ncbi:hypothetical protein CO058_01550 [candidate division WWE3 bacterium CG_4_9_14_0_2_um_filter_35_11]|uniref:Uncharacterized protein n=1 Tax=candidate division WWE3 bacterium CG_4_9_14_0_2_um_filter_35_11 TaxID=1975077 RepID=A0A2M8EM73_UNCKA|nr:MAG: hypothetical protein COV25_03930 [candidate division WWE3 bacterium CG10_big_fil_rev_8_21_14_0_10_35_32]PJC23846.1 MAG: hypothetical protein CO058_01550 [candidate division WWE3 bacterium CG_4_9_14_0_2_um_filter_35_11]
MNLNKIIEIANKELKSYLDHAQGYLLLSILVSVLYFLFLKTFFVVGTASVRSLFELLPWILTIFVPAVTMSSIASEKEKQTLEYLITQPITPKEIIFGKILGAWIFSSIGILLTLPLAFIISTIGKIDTGETVAGYLGALILILTLSSLGVAISSFYKNQISAFLTTATVIFLLNIISTDLISINLPVSVSNLLSNLSISDNYFSIIRGVLEIPSIVYFALFIYISINIGITNIEKVRFSKMKAAIIKSLKSLVLILLISAITIYSAGYAKGRVDLTSNKKYTLSQISKDTLKSGDKVRIDVYASNDLPQQFQAAFSELKNTLNDYTAFGGDKIQVQYLLPDDHKAELDANGITPIQFNVIGNDQYQVKQGYMALVISNDSDQSKKEIIPYVNDINSLEFELTKAISKVKESSKPTIAFATGNGEKDLYQDFAALKSMIGSDYTVTTVALPSEETAKVPDLSVYKAIVFAGQTTSYSKASEDAIISFVKNGGNILYMPDLIQIDLQTTSASKNEEINGDLFNEFGIKVNPDLVYDLRSNVPTQVGTESGVIVVSYPFWTVGVLSSENTKELPGTAIFPWSSSLEITSPDWETLYSTSVFGNKQIGTFNIGLEQNLSETDLQTIPLVAISGISDKDKGIMIVAGTTRMFDNQFVSQSRENALLATSLFEKLASEKNFSQISAKNILGSQFKSTTNLQKDLVNYGSPAASLLLLIMIGIARYTKKKRQKHMLEYI